MQTSDHSANEQPVNLLWGLDGVLQLAVVCRHGEHPEAGLAQYRGCSSTGVCTWGPLRLVSKHHEPGGPRPLDRLRQKIVPAARYNP